MPRKPFNYPFRLSEFPFGQNGEPWDFSWYDSIPIGFCFGKTTYENILRYTALVTNNFEICMFIVNTEE